MALQYQLDSIDDLNDEVKSLYVEKGGKFILGIDGLPKQEDVTGLKSKVDELLAEKKEAAKRAAEAEEAVKKANEDAARKNGDVEALEKSWKEKLSNRESELQKQLDAMMGSVTSMTVDNIAVKLANELAVQGSADILIPHIKSRLAAENREGQFITVVRDSSGKPSAASLDDLKNEFINNPAFAPVIVGSKASGGGAKGSENGGGAAKTITRLKFDGMSQSERAAYVKSGGSVTDQ